MLGIMLVLTTLSPFIITETFADSFVMDLDKSQYRLGDSLVLSGEIFDFGMPVIAMSIYDPDRKILSANALDISTQKTFTKSIYLDSPFYEKIGEYMIKLDYGQISKNYYFVIESEHSEPEILVENEEPKIILLYTDKKQYIDKDVIKITGSVSTLDSTTVLIGIYDPFGMPAGFYFGDVDSNLEFSTSFLVKSGVNFRTDGTYSIKAHYAKTEAVYFFDFYKNSQPIIKNDIEDETNKNTNLKEKIDESFNEIISDTTPISSHEKIINKEDVGVDFNTVDDFLVIDNSQQYILNPDENLIIQNTVDDFFIKEIKNSETKEKKIINEKNNSKKITPKNKKQTNLTVEDIELGKLLNQITLKCDSSTYTDTISYYDGMGPALYRLCKFDSSLNFFNESLIDNPNDVEVLVNKGSTLGKLGHFSEAIVYYDQAIKIDPDFLPAKNNKANALANLGNFDNAILLYREILEKNPDYTIAQNNHEIALSLATQIYDIIDKPLNDYDENTTIQKFLLSEKTNSSNHQKQKPMNFFEQVSSAFFNLDTLFAFLN